MVADSVTSRMHGELTFFKFHSLAAAPLRGGCHRVELTRPIFELIQAIEADCVTRRKRRYEAPTSIIMSTRLSQITTANFTQPPQVQRQLSPHHLEDTRVLNMDMLRTGE